tara:strand:+ start:493 stop:1125 length:633 start_codon:yes stop_codon:yes gene_type:complete
VKNKIDLIESTFNLLQSSNLDFVVLRNFDLIPDYCSLENDIDLLVSKDDISKLNDIMATLGYSNYDDKGIYLYGAEPHRHYINKEMNVHFDVVNGLYYRSLLNHDWFVKIDEPLQHSILKHKLTTESFWKYRPSTEDLVLHLCCHCIFDKKSVSQKYSDVILHEYQLSNKSKLHNDFEQVFFKASDLIIEQLENKNVNDLFESYISYSKY